MDFILYVGTNGRFGVALFWKNILLPPPLAQKLLQLGKLQQVGRGEH
jgi:hypothetical protein